MSKESSTRKFTTTGFSQKEFSSFLRAGDLIGTGTGDIRDLKPKSQDKTFVTSSEDGGTRKTTFSGFEGKFAGVSQAEVDRLGALFLNRQRQVQSGKAQPGRKGLFLNRGQ